MSDDTTEKDADLGSRLGGLGPARVLVVEDQESLRNVLVSQLLLDGHEVVSAGTVQGALPLVDRVLDVAILDIDLPDGRGFEIVEHLRGEPGCVTSVIMMTGNPSEESLALSLNHGILEFLFKPFGVAEIRAAMARALEASLRWRRRMAALEQRLSGAEGPSLPSSSRLEDFEEEELEKIVRSLRERHGLTERESETLQLMLTGLQNPEIASKLQISANTVKYHARNLLMKLGMSSRTELFRTLLNQNES